MNEEPRRILWTGGFDSTWLVVDALLDGYRVDAVVWRGYGMQPGWQKVDNEDEARRRITWELPGDLQRRLRERAEADYGFLYPHVRAVWEELHERQPVFSAQNMILAALPKLVGPSEAAFVSDDWEHDSAVQREVLRREGVSTPIADRSKRALLADAGRRGFNDLLAVTWSCEATSEYTGPVPCGECEPCRHRLTVP